jgi:hypothetical protein
MTYHYAVAAADFGTLVHLDSQAVGNGLPLSPAFASATFASAIMEASSNYQHHTSGS